MYSAALPLWIITPYALGLLHSHMLRLVRTSALTLVLPAPTISGIMSRTTSIDIDAFAR